MANSVDPDQTAPIGSSLFWVHVVCLSLMLGNYLQQTTSADDIFRCIFFLALEGLSLNITSMHMLCININLDVENGLYNYLIYYANKVSIMQLNLGICSSPLQVDRKSVNAMKTNMSDHNSCVHNQ